jgi:hypothetical protein
MESKQGGEATGLSRTVAAKSTKIVSTVKQNKNQK